ncbi:hypothetical protein [Marinobacter sp. OP 3.4]|uniref:hypothetical protein n=1 Tax=Marinobacter sp. OP 3.4 TaxID=3076501 RepID=UPI002E1AE13A
MKFLRNRKTGVVFPYHPLLAKNTDMEPCSQNGQSAFEEVDATGPATVESPSAPAVSDNGIVISRASKAELLKFAYENFGVEMDESLKVPELRDEVKKLVESEE